MLSSRLAFAVLATTAMTAGAAHADVTVLNGTLTTTATLTSDYVYRGFSQNDENITPMLGTTWAHASGVHVDLFAAPVNFRASNDDASVELDAALGYTHQFSDKLSGDVTLAGYFYPGVNSDADYNYFEGLGSLSYDWGFATTTGLVAYSPDYSGAGTGEALFVEASVEAPVAVRGHEFSLSAGYGCQTVQRGQDYNTWRAGVNYDLKGVTLGVAYHDTNLGSDQCDGMCSARAVVSAAYSF